MQRKRVNRFVGLFYGLKIFDRRKYLRFKVNELIECQCFYVESGQQIELSAQIIDVSMGGVLLMIGESKIYPGTELKVSFKLPNYPEEIVINGRVVRTYRRQAEVSHYSGLDGSPESKLGLKRLFDYACSNQIKKPLF